MSRHPLPALASAAFWRSLLFERWHFSALGIGLLIFALLHVKGVPALLKLLPHGMARETVERHVKDWREHEEGGDSWWPMAVAYEHLRAGRPNLYEAVFFQGGVKFQYPPSALLVYRGLEAIDPAPTDAARLEGDLYGKMHGPGGWRDKLESTSHRSVLVSLAASIALLLLAARSQPSWAAYLLLALAGSWVGLYYYPLTKAYTLGQIQTTLTALVALGMLCLMQKQELPAGALFAVATLIKPQVGLLLVWGLLRRRWGFAAAFGGVFMAGSLLSVAFFGWAPHFEYLKVMNFLARHGESFYSNQSMNGLLHRLLGNGNNLRWEGGIFPPYSLAVHAGTLASSLALCLAALWPPRRAEAREVTCDFMLALLAVVLASPVAWEHHYGMLLPIFAAVLPLAAQPHPRRRWRIAGLGASYLLTGHFFQFTQHFASSWLNPIQSYAYFGGLLLFALLWRMRNEGAPARRSSV